MDNMTRRGFLGMLAGAMAATGLDLVPGLGRVARALERAHERETTFVVTGLDIFAPLVTWGVALLPPSHRHGLGRVLCAGSGPGLLETRLLFDDGIVIEDGALLQVVGQSADDKVLRPALFVRNVRGALVVERPAGAWRCVPFITKYVVESSPAPRINYAIQWEEGYFKS